MQKEQIEQIIDDLETTDISNTKQIDGGLIEYRKYLYALWYIEKRLKRLKEYKEKVVEEIDYRIKKEEETILSIRKTIEFSLETDPIADKTKTGGRTLVLPDIATVSISKVTDKVIIDDPDKVLSELGKEFEKIKISLDTTKAKEYLEMKDELPEGAHKEKSRTLSIRFTK